MAFDPSRNIKLDKEVNRALFVRNLPYQISSEEMYKNYADKGIICSVTNRYDLFGKYGAIRQIRLGNEQETKGTAFVVYEDIFDAKNVPS